jgi:RNA polymerase sigma factor (sigma-70 family)
VARCERIVAELGPRYAPLFHLRYVEDFSPVEVAQRLGLTVSTVHARSHRARTHVKRRLVEEGLAAGGGARPAMAAGGSG